MITLHLLAGCDTGGIEVLCKDYLNYSINENIVVSLHTGGRIAEEIRECGFEVIELPCSKSNMMAIRAKILELCQERHIEAVVAHHASAFSHIFMMSIKKKYPHIRTIAYAHGNAYDMCAMNRKGAQLRKYVLSKSLNRVDRIVAISYSVKDSLISMLGTRENNIDVIYNGVDVSKFECNEAAAPMDILTLVYVGRLEAYKGVQNILTALAELQDQIPYQFTVIGDGSYRRELEALSGRLGITSRVTFMGTRREIPELLCQSGIFIHMPDCQEGFGITVVEAMAAGLICIVNDHGALPEIVEDGVNGYIIGEAAGRTFAETIEHIYETEKENDPDGVLEGIRQKARERAKDFSIEHYSKQLDKLVGRSC